MKYTDNLKLKMPENSDKFDIENFNDNSESIDGLAQTVTNLQTNFSSNMQTLYGTTNRLTTALGGLSLKKISREDYDGIDEKSETTVYFVVEDSGSVKLYLGEVEIAKGSGGSLAGGSTVMSDGVVGISGTAVKIEEE